MAKMIINGEVYSGSTNYASAITYIKEDGTKSTVQKELDSRPVNNNLLINSNFANPVNQRGVVSPVVNSNADDKFYTIDRWQMYGTGKLIINDGESITLENTGNLNLYQYIDSTTLIDGKSVVLSAKVNGKVYTSNASILTRSGGHCVIRIYNNDAETTWDATLYVQYYSSEECYRVAIGLESSITVEWIKLELGEVATPYVPRLYEEELELCQRYYQIIHNNLFPWSATTSDMVFHQHFKPMRITPTISIIEATVYLENQKQSGFTFRIDYKTDRRFSLYAKKSSHGLKGKAYVGLFLNVALDAEL